MRNINKNIIDFKKNELINDVLNKFYETYALTLDTAEFVPDKDNKKIDNYIFSNMKKKFKEIDIFYLLYLEQNGVKLGIFDRLKIWFSGLRQKFNALNVKPIKQTKVVKDKARDK